MAFSSLLGTNPLKLTVSFSSKFSTVTNQIFKIAILTSAATLGNVVPFELRPAFSANPSYIRSPTTGIEFYDYKTGDGESVTYGSKVVFHYKGRLAGRQGWVYDDTSQIDEPVRLTLGSSKCIKGLELGLIGDGDVMPPMQKGGKRRLIIPGKLGYQDKEQLPIPLDFGQQQRLYSTVLNEIRGLRESEALGDSLAGRLVLDVDLLRVNNKSLKRLGEEPR